MKKILYATIILNWIVVAVLLFDRQFNQYHTGAELPRIDTIISIDTTPPPPIIIKLPQQPIPKPVIVYVDSSGKSIPITQIDTTKHEQAQLYQDSIEDDNLTLYYQSTVKGQLLNHSLDYKLKVPQFITKKIEISKPYPVPVNSLLLTGGFGGNINQFSSLSLGLQFVSAKGWAVGYEYDFLQKAHHVKLGIKLIQFKPK